MLKINMTDEMREAIHHYSVVMDVSETEAKEDATRMVESYMKDNPSFSQEFAEASWIEDTMDMSEEAIDEMTEKAKKNAPKLHARSVDAYGRKHERTRKPNEAKREIIDILAKAFAEAGIENTVSNVERQVDFSYGGVSYSITLTAHRAPKEGK